jgi:hypothetical protein
MRYRFVLVPLLLCATPAFAQDGPSPGEMAQVQRVLGDPATADRLANVMQALSKAFLDLPVGEVRAAAEGRPPTPAERHMTVGDMARRDDPNFDRDLQRRMAAARPMIHQSMNAMGSALPEMMQGLMQAERALKRAAANMPDPNYPRR